MLSPVLSARRTLRVFCQRAAWAALLLGVVATPAVAQWKWRDAKGQVHASDIPPPREIPEKNVMQRPDPPAQRVAPAASPEQPTSTAQAASAPGKLAVDPQLEDQRRRIEQEKLAREKAESEKVALQRKENCARARDVLNTLDSGLRIARVKPDGEREILTDEQRAAEVQRTRGAMATDCR
ncbi:MAG: DUF4124 domain-containing protein [Rubrivivax sp.]